MLNPACQTGQHPHAERARDLYETPPVTVEALLRVETLPHRIWEPAAGRGAIVKILRKHGHDVTASDIVAYDGFRLDLTADIFTLSKAPTGVRALVTNPPYQCATAFAEHALDLVPQVFLLLRLAFLESVGRTRILEASGLRAVHVFRSRLPMMHRDGWDGPRASSALPFAWFCWSRGYGGPTTVSRI